MSDSKSDEVRRIKHGTPWGRKLFSILGYRSARRERERQEQKESES